MSRIGHGEEGCLSENMHCASDKLQPIHTKETSHLQIEIIIHLLCTYNWRSPLSAKTSCFIEPSVPYHSLPSLTQLPKVLHQQEGWWRRPPSKQARHSHGHKPEVFYLMKTFAVETLHNCNLLCCMKCWTSLRTFKAVAMSRCCITSQTCTGAEIINLYMYSMHRWKKLMRTLG